MLNVWLNSNGATPGAIGMAGDVPIRPGDAPPSRAAAKSWTIQKPPVLVVSGPVSRQSSWTLNGSPVSSSVVCSPSGGFSVGSITVIAGTVPIRAPGNRSLAAVWKFEVKGGVDILVLLYGSWGHSRGRLQSRDPPSSSHLDNQPPL